MFFGRNAIATLLDPQPVVSNLTRRMCHASSTLKTRSSNSPVFSGSYAATMDYTHLITIEPDKRSGQACIRGLRMTVRDVLEYLASGMTHEEILSDFPDLTDEDIRACLAYAADRERRLIACCSSVKPL